MKKVHGRATEALAGLLTDGMTVMAGGFGLCGTPDELIDAIRESGMKDLTVISNNAGIDGVGLGKLLKTRQVTKMISSYVAENGDGSESPKRLAACDLPPTGTHVVDPVITDLGGFTIDKKGDGGMPLVERADGVTEDEIRAKTQGAFTTRVA